MNAIEVRDVHKVYRRYSRRRQFATLKSALLSGAFRHDLKPEDGFEALSGVSFDMPAGKTLGIIGRNGSGKSTMLKLIAGIGKPTTGQVVVHGRVSALIELGAGFHPEISGRENVFINGMMLGLSKREIANRFDDIVSFAELEAFIDAPVKTYSSGMYMRLGFSVAIHVDPDVLLVDEVLAVGDEAFTHKCLDRFADLRRRGRTVLLVTHSLELVARFCDDALWLDGGKIRAQGDPRRVIDAYLLDVTAKQDQQLQASSSQVVAPEGTSEPEDMFKAVEGRWGSREAEIEAVEFLDASGRPSHVIESGAALLIRFAVRSKQPLNDVVVGVGIFGADGVCCYGTNTVVDGAAPGALNGRGEVSFSIPRLDLVEGTYKIDVAIHRGNGAPYDYHRQLYTLRVHSGTKEVGMLPAAAHVDLRRGTEDHGIQVRTVEKRVLSQAEVQAFSAAARASGKTVVFTNGVFDLLHPGHVRYLNDARALGHLLIVGVNSDRSVRLLKGPSRPVTPEQERAEILLSLGSVDAVVIFDDETPLALITLVQPDLLVKGADWGERNIVGRDVVEARGGRVVRLAFSQGHSTTALIQRVGK